MNKAKRFTHSSTVKILFLLALAAAVALSCSSCSPALKIKAKYAYQNLDIEYGSPVPTDIDSYADMSGMTDEEKAYIRKHSSIEYDGIKVPGAAYDKPGDYKLTINYNGRKYRTFYIKVRDHKAPEFTRAEDMTIIAGMAESTLRGFSNDPDYNSMFQAVDDGSGLNLHIDSSSVNEDEPGDYKVYATATDSNGNKTEKTAVVHVLKPGYGLNTTYVYVNTGEQHLTYFKDGKAVLSCPVVTGNVSAGHSTPKGVFMVNWKCMNITLKGEDYESPVTYWMPFIGGQVGFHDAPWRGAFGGNIYRYSGSHGCINMPSSYAAQLYSMLEVGTPVVIE